MKRLHFVGSRLAFFATLFAGAACSAANSGARAGTMPNDAGTPPPADGGGDASCAAPTSSCSPANVAIAPAETFPFSGTGTALAVGDVNGDGKADLVVADSLAPAAKGLEILLSKGDGTFAAPAAVPESAQGYSVVLADFNGDCKTDVLVPSFDNATNADSVDLLLGNGDGTFKKPITADVTNGGTNSLALVTADFNGDGKLDFAATSTANTGIDVALWAATGFSAATLFHGSDVSLSPSIGGLAAGDLTGDGAAELVTASGSKGVCVLPNDGSGSFAAAPKCFAGARGYMSDTVAVADINGDGKLDVALGFGANVAPGAESGNIVDIFLGNGDGTLGSAVVLKHPDAFYGPVALVDVNHDGKPDLVTYYGTDGSGEIGNGFTVWLNDGNGHFPAIPSAKYAAGGGPQQPGYGDFLGDGLVGMVAWNQVGDGVTEHFEVLPASCRK